MQLYLGNPTNQDFIACTRPPEMTRTLEMRVPAGGQILYGGENLNSQQIDAIIGQLRNYGLMGIDEVMGHRGYVSLVFAKGKPVPVGVIQAVFERNRNTKREKGETFRKAAAIGIDQRAAQFAQADQLAPQRHTEIEIIEDTDRGSTMPREPGEKPVLVGLHVDHESAPGRAPHSPKKGRRRAA